MKFAFSCVLCLVLLVFFDLSPNASARSTRKRQASMKVCGRDLINAMDFFCPETRFTLPYELRYVGGKLFEGFGLICYDHDQHGFSASVGMIFMADCRKIFSTTLRAETSANKPVLVRFA